MFVGGTEQNRSAGALAVLLQQASRAAVRRLLATHGDPFRALLRARPLRARALVARLLDDCADAGVALLVPAHCQFPRRLQSIPDPPMLLYFTGNPETLARPAIAIVGARRASRFGIELAERLATDLSGRGVLIVSGLALGIDSAAHRAAREQRGSTLAVLGSGLARVQPITNLPLAQALLDSGGALLSEYPLHLAAKPYHFPERNRLISGLSAGVVVVEASVRSGSLITARCALEQGREVMAVPGAAGLPSSAGCNRLLRQGAGLVESAEDVFDALGMIASELPEQFIDRVPPQLGASAQSVLSLLGATPLCADEVGAVLNLSGAQCAIAFTELELGGFVARYGEGYIRRPS